MCTPENLRPLCSCPHLAAAAVGRVVRAVVAVALAGAVVWAVTAGYGWVFALVAWVGLMGVCGLVSAHRSRAFPPPAPDVVAEPVTGRARAQVSR